MAGHDRGRSSRRIALCGLMTALGAALMLLGGLFPIATYVMPLAAGVLLLQPLKPVLENPVLTPAFDNVVPALFGAMAYKYYRKNLGLAVWPLLMMSALFILVPSLQSQTSILIIPSGALAILLAWLKYRKDRKA